MNVLHHNKANLLVVHNKNLQPEEREQLMCDFVAMWITNKYYKDADDERMKTIENLPDYKKYSNNADKFTNEATDVQNTDPKLRDEMEEARLAGKLDDFEKKHPDYTKKVADAQKKKEMANGALDRYENMMLQKIPLKSPLLEISANTVLRTALRRA